MIDPMVRLTTVASEIYASLPSPVTQRSLEVVGQIADDLLVGNPSSMFFRTLTLQVLSATHPPGSVNAT